MRDQKEALTAAKPARFLWPLLHKLRLILVVGSRNRVARTLYSFNLTDMTALGLLSGVDDERTGGGADRKLQSCLLDELKKAESIVVRHTAQRSEEKEARTV